ncbi:nesprin-2-like [Cynoglossus semilaevis]|uniref:nesprin-2-like n=1 Tax=Cynoglossus semilaevis TaxID=244447 RepID=UPI000497FA6D|nr:nesprin-2-like [Cynoglossus semilaevis]
MSEWLQSDSVREDVPTLHTDRPVSPPEGVRGMESSVSGFDSQVVFTGSILESTGGNTEETDEEEDLMRCGRLETRWLLWHEFMKEHQQLDAWLRLAEQAVTSPNFHVTYSAAKEELRMLERLQYEAGPRLVQLDSLTHRNRTLTRLFRGAMRARLLASARDCGQRWDQVNAKLESTRARLKSLVSEWEEFEAEGEELALWLTNLEVRLTEVDHLNENTCEKLRQLQSFQKCVCENSGRVNTLLQHGEELIQRSEASDAQRVECRLLELLRHCSHVYNNIARTHTRLLSMRLVFEDDWILSQASDSGCPSETPIEEEPVFDKPRPDSAPPPARLGEFSQSNSAITVPLELPSPVHHPLPPSSSSPTHEHLGLEWDPSVDIGRSVSCNDADSSYFSISTGQCNGDDLKRWSYLSSLSSWSGISNDITNQETDQPSPCLDHTDVFSAAAPGLVEPWLIRDQCVTSTPDRPDGEQVSLKGRRLRAWLGDQSPAPPGNLSVCSRAVQTEEELKVEDFSFCEEDDCCLSEHSVTSSTASPILSSSSPIGLHSRLLFVLLAAAVVVLAVLMALVQDSPCHRSSRLTHGYHLTLRYINGPPPT